MGVKKILTIKNFIFKNKIYCIFINIMSVREIINNTTITLTQICRSDTALSLNVLGGSSTLIDSIPELYASLEIQRIA